MSIEDVRRFWDRRPCNAGRSRAPVGSYEWAQDVIANKQIVEPHLFNMLRPERWRDKEVLDAGCGIGIVACVLSCFGAHVTGFDLSPQSLMLANALCSHLHLGAQGRFYLHNLEEPLDPAYIKRYDLVFSWGVIHHTPDPLRALCHLRLSLKDSGQLRLMVYNRWSTKALGLCLRHPIVALTKGIDAAVALQSEAQSRCPITRTYTRESATALLEAAGFKVQNMEVAHIFPYAIGPYKRGRYQKTWYWRLLPPGLFRWLEGKLGWHLLIWARPE